MSYFLEITSCRPISFSPVAATDGVAFRRWSCAGAASVCGTSHGLSAGIYSCDDGLFELAGSSRLPLAVTAVTVVCSSSAFSLRSSAGDLLNLCLLWWELVREVVTFLESLHAERIKCCNRSAQRRTHGFHLGPVDMKKIVQVFECFT